MTPHDSRLDRNSAQNKPLRERLARYAPNSPTATTRDIAKSVARLTARPGEQPKRGAICTLLDTSGSMSGDPISQAKRGLQDFARQAIAGGFHIGIVAFDDDCRDVVCSTNEIQVLADSLSRVQTGGGTLMAPPLRLAIQRLSQEKGERVIFLVTDGQAADADETLRQAIIAKAAGIDVMTLGTEGADHNFLSKLSTRSDLARKTTTASLQTGISQAARLLLR